MATLNVVKSIDWKSVLIGAVFVWFVLPWILSKFSRPAAASKSAPAAA
jgi:hypothetical protein